MFAAAEGGPFERSKLAPTALETLVAELIYARQGRAHPIPIAEIIEWFEEHAATVGTERLTERRVKDVVEQLRAAHRCPIGARRGQPEGYFWIVDAADREAAVEPYRRQILAMWRTLRVLDSTASLRELHGQLRLEE